MVANARGDVFTFALTGADVDSLVLFEVAWSDGTPPEDGEELQDEARAEAGAYAEYERQSGLA